MLAKYRGLIGAEATFFFIGSYVVFCFASTLATAVIRGIGRNFFKELDYIDGQNSRICTLI